MSTNFAIIGGDLRIIKLAKMLAKDGNKVYTYGLEKAEELKNEENIIFCEKINKAISEHVEVVIGPIPFSSNGININAPFSYKEISIRELMHVLNAKILIAGSITPDVYDMANDEYIEIIDVMKREELAVLNTISTAEGTIEIAIANTNKIIHGSNVLILGFGRIGKVLARKMTGLSAKVTCAARKDEDLAWIQAYGYKTTNINNIGENLRQYDIIINTVPHMILTEEIENSLKNEADIDDLLKQIHDMDFSEYIHHLFKKYHLKEADIIRKSGLERTYAYKIIRGEKGKNAKDKIYRLALAMNLTQKETNHLLSLNNAGDLYPHNARDLILLNGLLKKQTVEEVNIELYNHDLEPLKD